MSRKLASMTPTLCLSFM
ncbi:hypothetical protein Gorai_006410 [Gossypium raimondii]|uniref:Uncharacterized protein n=1 Tax=Gossypium raimondii TaxID=29730 RepID=A0A7J8QF70_GOSRA|nr:hypothetical protein [Gossypium raimondii]